MLPDCGGVAAMAARPTGRDADFRCEECDALLCARVATLTSSVLDRTRDILWEFLQMMITRNNNSLDYKILSNIQFQAFESEISSEICTYTLLCKTATERSSVATFYDESH